ncbi:hypothetical protein ACSAZL_08780 [Methanosarcina sp. T3]|uniref:hypothetical protein n=1 Tax=Methanosarcina sp. T3 TaxID=3439062 RepID=UPI003F863D88
MVLDKIRNFCQNYKVNLEPKVSIKPSITLFGILSFELLEIEPKDAVELEAIDPENWSPETKTKINEYLQNILDMSLEEYCSQLKKELEKTKIETVKSILESVTKNIKESPLLTLDEFESRTENRDVCSKEYSKFVGRQDDLNSLKDFVTISSDKILILTGPGAIGKTRLSIEFARLMRREIEDWDVYFIHRENNFNKFRARKYTLLILDEASRYPEIERSKLIDFVLHPPKESSYMKLILISRPIFKDSIESDLRERYASFTDLHLEKGNIAEFLQHNLDVKENIALKIEKLADNSFLNAIFYNEYFKEKGKINESKNILAHRVEKYANDICNRSSYRIEEVRLALSRISLITPVSWAEDKEFLKMYKKDLDVVEEIIRLSDSRNLDLLFYRQSSFTKNTNVKYDFRYDPVADFLRAEYIKKDESVSWIQKHISYFPYRMTCNLFLIQRYAPNHSQRVSQIISEIWMGINSSKGNNLEYFEAFVFLTSDFLPFNLKSIEDLNLDNLIDSYKSVSSSSFKHEVSFYYSSTLANLIIPCGLVKRFDYVNNCLKEMRDICKKDSDNMAEIFAKGLCNAINSYGIAQRFEDVNNCIKEMRELSRLYPDHVAEIFAKGLHDAMNHYNRARRFDNICDFLSEVRDLYKEHPNEVVDKLAKCLHIAICYSGSNEQFNDMSYFLDETRELYNEYPGYVVEELAKSLANATHYYGSTKRFDDMHNCLKEMDDLYKKYPDNVAEKLAYGFINATNYYGSSGQFDYVHEYLNKMKEICKEYPDHLAEKFSKCLYNAIYYYNSAGRFQDVNNCLKEAKILYKKHPDSVDEKLREVIHSCPSDL